MGAFVFAIGYRKSGLGKRIALLLVRALGRRTLGLDRLIAVAVLALAKSIPTARARRTYRALSASSSLASRP